MEIFKVKQVDSAERTELKERLVKKLAPKHGKDEIKTIAENSLSYNVIAPRALSDITGIPYDTILSRSREDLTMRSKYRLKLKYPFRSLKSLGQKFILLDDNCLDMIRRSLV